MMQIREERIPKRMIQIWRKNDQEEDPELNE
jgi:hypothetical protein